MFADVFHLLADFLDLDAPPLLLIDNRVNPQGEIALELGHARVDLLHLLSDGLVDGLRLLHLLLEGPLEVLDLLVDLVQELQFGSDGLDVTVYVLLGL